MVGYASHASTIKSSNRTKASGLRVKTNVTGFGTSHGRNRAIASTDWRGMASATSSSGASVKRHTLAKAKHGSGESESSFSSLVPGTEKQSSSHIQYRQPAEKQAP
jgi:hypothetical protein